VKERIALEERSGEKQMPKDACYHKVKARYRVFPSAYASGAIAKCRKVGAANYGTGGKKKKKKGKASGGVLSMSNGGAAVTKAKRPSSNPNVARGCGVVMSNKRKATQYS
jgi:hypothetical protein